MLKVIFTIVITFSFTLQASAQKVSFKNAQVYQGEELIFQIKPITKDHVGFSLQNLEGKALVNIYNANIARGAENGYVIKFLDDNKYCILFKMEKDSLFFKNIITELVTIGAVKNADINKSGKQKYLKTHDSSKEVSEPGDLINY